MTPRNLLRLVVLVVVVFILAAGYAEAALWRMG